jgi:hypothetical protein
MNRKTARKIIKFLTEDETRNTVTGDEFDESTRFDVTIYFSDGRVPERHADVTAARARELEQTFTTSPVIQQIDVDVTSR